MTNKEISQLLRNVAASYSVKNEAKYRFQIVAYMKAADAIESATTELKNLAEEEKLDSIPGVGPSIKQHLDELFETGSVKHFNQVMKDVPPAMFTLLTIPSFGPKKAFKLVTHFQLINPKTVIEDLEKLALEGKIAALEGFGTKSQDDILQAISEYRLGVTKNTRMVLPFASELAEKIVSYLKESPAVLDAYPLGSLRRMKETIGDIDIAVSSNDPDSVLEYFTAYPHTERIIEKGPQTSSILISGGRHIDLMIQPPERFGSLLQHFTGSKAHNIHLREVALKKGLSLSEYGIKNLKDKNGEITAFPTEKSFYNALGMDWIPPEMREDIGEIELAAKHMLPRLVETEDIKGDFHLHSNFPIEPSHDMGKNTYAEMIEKALSLGYTYLGFSEHNPSVSQHTADQAYALLEKRSKIIEQLSIRYNKSVRIFSLLETDILASGELGIDDRSLELLDGTIVSIHSSFSMSKDDMTKRVLAGLSHPKAKILAHPTGRLLNQRNGYDLLWDDVFDFVKKHNKALEINAYPSRLDLPDVLVRQAITSGVKLIINTDSHAVAQMNLMPYGVAVARRGWATADDILNTWEYNRLNRWFNG